MLVLLSRRDASQCSFSTKATNSFSADVPLAALLPSLPSVSGHLSETFPPQLPPLCGHKGFLRYHFAVLDDVSDDVSERRSPACILSASGFLHPPRLPLNLLARSVEGERASERAGEQQAITFLISEELPFLPRLAC